ncbi:MAG: glycosyltransferase [Armatimonadota bacterium]|nr:glycosyltransferase [Armatimonadota bacterium]
MRRYITHPYYWRRAAMQLIECLTRQMHVETHLDRTIAHGVLPVIPQQPGGRAAGIRLLYVAPRFDYGNPARGYSYEENHFLPVLMQLGFAIIRLDSLTLVRTFGRQRAGDLLVEAAFRLRPDIAFFVLFKDDFPPDAVEELQRLGCVTFNWFTDDHWRFDSFSRRWARHFSWAITTDPQAVPKYHAAGMPRVIRSQWGVNHRLYRPLDRPRRFPITFIGQPHGNRRQVIARLRAAGLPVKTFGYGWRSGKISTRRAVEIINETEVNLNLSNASVGGVDQVKGRDFEVPACRALLITKHVQALADYYELGRDILVYDTVDDLIERIRWALQHPADVERMREAAYRRVLAEHTYEHRFQEIFSRAGILS